MQIYLWLISRKAHVIYLHVICIDIDLKITKENKKNTNHIYPKI